MVNSVTLINSAEGVNAKINAPNIPINWRNQCADFPIPANYTSIKPVQFNGWSNPTYTLNFMIYLSGNPSGFLTWEEWNKLVKSTTPTKLNIVIGDTDVSFKSYANSASGTSDIYIQIMDWNTSLNPGDNINSNIITINATVMETTI